MYGYYSIKISAIFFDSSAIFSEIDLLSSSFIGDSGATNLIFFSLFAIAILP